MWLSNLHSLDLCVLIGKKEDLASLLQGSDEVRRLQVPEEAANQMYHPAQQHGMRKEEGGLGKGLGGQETGVGDGGAAGHRGHRSRRVGLQSG